VAKDCGDGVYVLGIPIWEGPRAADCRRGDKTDRVTVRQENRTERQGKRQEEKSERTEDRSYEDAYQTFFRNFGTGETPLEGAWGATMGAYGQIGSSLAPVALMGATGGLSSIPSAIGGLLGSVGESLGLVEETEAGTAVDLFPVVLAVGAGVVLLMVLSDDGSGGRR
jgi:hypothetical protein